VSRPILLGCAIVLAAGLTGCPGGGDDLVVTTAVTIGEPIGTVVTIDWTTDEPTGGRIEVALEGEQELVRTSAAPSATEHQVLLLGLLPSATYGYELVVEQDGQEQARLPGTFTTGQAPAELPELPRDDTLVGPPIDGYMVTTVVHIPFYAVILDGDGRYVWWHQEEQYQRVMGRVRLSLDGTSVLYNSFTAFGSGEHAPGGEIVRVSLDGSTTERLDLPGSHHDFVELPDGTLAVLVLDPATVDDFDVLGDRIDELHPDGTVTTVWSVWDDYEYTDPDPPDPLEWSHANTLDYDPDDDAYIVGFRNLSALVKIDRASGQRVWQLGGEGGDFTLVDGDRFPYQQHQFIIDDAGLLVFDNGPFDEFDSRARRYDIDWNGQTVSEAWSFGHEPPTYNFAYGDVSPLDDGRTLVTWGAHGQIEAVDEAGTVSWRLATELGSGLGYLDVMDSLYR